MANTITATTAPISGFGDQGYIKMTDMLITLDVNIDSGSIASSDAGADGVWDGRGIGSIQIIKTSGTGTITAVLQGDNSSESNFVTEVGDDGEARGNVCTAFPGSNMIQAQPNFAFVLFQRILLTAVGGSWSGKVLILISRRGE